MEVGVTDNSTISAFKEVISGLQQQLTQANEKLDNLQSSVDMCKDSVSALNTSIAESTNYMYILTTPYGVAIIAIVMVVICLIALKKGISLSKGETTISIGKTGDNNEK